MRGFPSRRNYGDLEDILQMDSYFHEEVRKEALEIHSKGIEKEQALQLKNTLDKNEFTEQKLKSAIQNGFDINLLYNVFGPFYSKVDGGFIFFRNGKSHKVCSSFFERNGQTRPWTILHYCAFYKKIKEMDCLLKNNATPDVKDLNGKTPMDYVLDYDVYYTKNTMDRYVVKTQHFKVMCDGCHMKEFVGKRYKCYARDNFDLCQNCYAKRDKNDRERYIYKEIKGNSTDFPSFSEFSLTQNLLEEANGLFYSLRYKEAIKKYNLIIESKPSYEAYLMRGKSFYKLEDYKTAMDDAISSIKINKTIPSVLLKTKCMMNLKKSSIEIGKELEWALNNDPFNKKFQKIKKDLEDKIVNSAIDLFQKDKLDDAISILIDGQKALPNSEIIRKNLEKINIKKLEEIQKNYNLAKNVYENKDINDAINILKEALKKYPKSEILGVYLSNLQNIERLLNSANLSIKNENYKEAVDYYNQVLLLTSNQKDLSIIYGNRALAYLRMKNFDNSLKDCEKAIQFDNIKGYLITAIIKAEISVDEAIQWIEKGLKKFPKDIKLQKKLEELIEYKNTIEENERKIQKERLEKERLDKERLEKKNSFKNWIEKNYQDVKDILNEEIYCGSKAGSQYIIKKITFKPEDFDRIYQEIIIFKSLEHENILPIILQHSNLKHNWIAVVTKYYENDLKRFIKNNQSNITNEMIYQFALQIIQGLEYIHSKDLIYKKLNLENLFISQNELMIGNFIPKNEDTKSLNQFYFAETDDIKEYDFYSFGEVLSVLSGCNSITKNKKETMEQEIINICKERGLDSSFINIITSCILEPSNRIDISNIKSSLQNINSKSKSSNSSNEKNKNESSSKKMSQYKIISKIEEGTYGIVHLCIKDEKQVALKKINCKDFDEANDALSEFTILLTLKHSNILKVNCIFTEESEKGFYVNIDSEYYKEGDLHKYVLSDQLFDKKDCILQIISGIEYIHSQNMLHRDLKPENILIKKNDEKLTFCICDFGFAKIINDQSKHSIKGTKPYMSVEMRKGEDYSFPHDIFSFGVILYFLYIKKVEEFALKLLNNEKQVYDSISKKFEKFPKIGNLIIQCLNINPKERPSPSDLKKIIEELSKEHF